LSFTFSAKEKDVETGLSYFGSRYYSSDLSIWLSVDPMSDKYASLSPYVYCANNPVKLVDPNGEAFDTDVDEDNHVITIHAVFYTTKKDAVALKKELDAWKKKGESYCYFSGGEEYSIKFNFEIQDFDDYNEASNEFNKHRNDGISNFFKINKTVENPKNEKVNGINYEGNNMYVAKGQIRSIRHEIGHSLGLGDWDHGLMKSGGVIYGISKNNIISIFESAGIRSQIHNFWGDWGNRQTDPICTSKTTYNKLGLFKRKHNH
jgi:RHS repeat-associated protein